MLKLSISVVLTFSVSLSIAQVDFIKKFTFHNYDYAERVIQTSDSGFAICGITVDSLMATKSEIVLLKLNKNGDSLWSKQFGPFNLYYVFGLCQFNTGDLVIGYAANGNYFLKTTANGDSISTIPIDSMGPSEMHLAKTQNLYAVGGRAYGDPYYGNYHSFICFKRFDKNLNDVWQRDVEFDVDLNPANNVIGRAIFVNDNEEIYVGGYGNNGWLWTPQLEQSDSNGTNLWFLTHAQILSESLYGSIEAITKTDNGNLVFSLSAPSFGEKYTVVEFDSLHQLLWQTKLSDFTNWIIEEPNKNILLASRSTSFIELNANGDSISHRIYDSAFTGYTNSHQKCFDQSVIAVGSTSGVSTDQRQFYVIKLKVNPVGIGDDALTSSNSAKVILGSNPAYDREKFFFTNLKSDKKYSLQIFNNIGQLVFEQSNLHSQTSISLSTKQIGSGCLIFTLRENDFPIQSGKFVITEGR